MIAAGELLVIAVLLKGCTGMKVEGISSGIENCKYSEGKLIPGFNSSYCHTTWDTILCWRSSPPGHLVSQHCPNNSNTSQTLLATKLCSTDGKWMVTNYSNCPDHTYLNPIDYEYEYEYEYKYEEEVTPEDNNDNDDNSLLMLWVLRVKVIQQVGYSISLITLIVAFVLLSTMKKLRCPRIMLLLHLITSFIMRAFIVLLVDFLFVKNKGLSKDLIEMEDGSLMFIPDRSRWECKALITLWNYCILANYSWILTEGLYLHNLIFLALFSDSSSISLYVILGWGFPILFMVPWVFLRIKYEDDYCWNMHINSPAFHVLRAPVIISVLLSFVLFINIARVLLVKMKSNVQLERRKLRYRMWAKSILVLIPLFGVHYVIFIWVIPDIEAYLPVGMRIAYVFIDQLFASFQGCFVSILYCLTNSEVRTELVRKWKSYKYSRQNCKRGSAQSLPASVLTTSRIVNVGGGRGGSLSSGSGFTPTFYQTEFNGHDVPSVCKIIQGQKTEMIVWKRDKRPSITQEIINSHSNGDCICYNCVSKQSLVYVENDHSAQNGFYSYHDSKDLMLDASAAMTNELTQHRHILNRRRSADSYAGSPSQAQAFLVSQSRFPTSHDDYCSPTKCTAALEASRST